MDLCGLYIASVETCVVPSVSAGTSGDVYGAMRLKSCGMLGSFISTTFGGALLLPCPLLGALNFLPDPYMEFITLLTIFQHPLMRFISLLHMNQHPIMGFLRLQLDGRTFM